MIRFLFKYSILLCLLFIALSFFLPKHNKAEEKVNSVNILAAASAFGTFITDIDGFCSRNPRSCETGKSLFGIMGDKIRQGASFTYQWLGMNLNKGAENTEQHASMPAAEKSPATNTEKSPSTPQKTEKRSILKQKSAKPKSPQEKFH